jgi:lactoylglutathione lyase
LNGTFELAIDLPASPDVDREFERVVNAGARPVYDPRDEPLGMRSSMVADPDGNLIEIGSWNRVTESGD